MADYIQMIDKKQLVAISDDFNYLEATRNFIGFKFFPMVRTENMKLAVLQLAEKGKIPVMALIHAFDSEAKIGDRGNPQEINYQLLLIKEKLNQGEALKKLYDNGMLNPGKQEALRRIFDDASNLISRVLTRIEAMACEALCTAKLTIKENNIDTVVDYQLPESHRLEKAGWSNPTHDILGDLAAIQAVAKNRIMRAVTTSKIVAYIMKNNAISALASAMHKVATLLWVKEFVLSNYGIEFVVYDGTYRLSALAEDEYRFFKEDVISFLTTDKVLGRTFFTKTPEEDFGIVDNLRGYVAVTQDKTFDPVALWTKASAVAFPCFEDINTLYICKISA